MLRAIRLPLLLCGMICATAAVAGADDWAPKMFKTRDHDFGTVARGANVQHEFVITNLYEEDVHIASVRSSCGCTKASITQQDIKTYEKAAIVAKFDTRTFLGSHSATLTVTIDRPYYAEVQLHVKGYIRSDVVLDPGGVDFGTIDAGQPADQTVAVEYAGRGDWQITGVKSNSPYITAEVVERQRTGGNVSYDLAVALSDDAPVGYLNGLLTVSTNDRRASEFAVSVDGRVASEVTVSPKSLYFGTVQAGETATKKLVIKGKKPFRVVRVECDDECFAAEVSSEAKRVHLVPVTFDASSGSGRMSTQLRIITDLGENGSPKLVAHAHIAQPLTQDTSGVDTSSAALTSSR